MLLLLHLLLFLMLPLCSSFIDTITPDQPLRDGDLLLSKESKFALGFFSPQNSTLRYAGVLYYTIPEQTVVWVLNRDHPINDTSGVLSIDHTGNFLLHQGNTTTHVWSTNVSISSVNANATHVAQLLDTGNLVLMMIQNDDKRVLWQGFDYPTDNLIPNMKIGLNRRTGLYRSMTSSKSETDPGTGTYSFGLNASGSPQLFTYQGSKPIVRAGHWNGIRFSGAPTMKYKLIYTSIFLNNHNEMSYMFTMANASILTRLTIDPDGYIQRTTWHERQGKWISFFTFPRDRCDWYGRCGPNSNCDERRLEFECTCLQGFEPKSPRDWFLKDGSAGCMRKEGAKVCEDGEGFVKVEATKPPDTSAARVNMKMNLEACREECLKDCSCSAYATANVSGSGSGCLSWYGDLMDIRVLPEGGQDLYVRVDAITLDEIHKQSRGFLAKKGMMTLLVVGAAVMMVLFISLFLILWKKMKGIGRQNKMLYNLRPGAIQDSPRVKEDDESSTNSELQFFDLTTIAEATNNFSTENELGRGGFGSVFKGQFSNGQEIAVKRLSKDSGQGKIEFRNEVILIAKLQHNNLVRLLGCCIQEEEKILVYEYLSNKSLDSFIFSTYMSFHFQKSSNVFFITVVQVINIFQHHFID